MGKPFLVHGLHETNSRPDLIHRPSPGLQNLIFPYLPDGIITSTPSSSLQSFVSVTICLYLWFLPLTSTWARAFNARPKGIISYLWNHSIGSLYVIFQKSVSQWASNVISQIFKNNERLRFHPTCRVTSWSATVSWMLAENFIIAKSMNINIFASFFFVSK